MILALMTVLVPCLSTADENVEACQHDIMRICDNECDVPCPNAVDGSCDDDYAQCWSGCVDNLDQWWCGWRVN